MDNHPESTGFFYLIRNYLPIEGMRFLRNYFVPITLTIGGVIGVTTFGYYIFRDEIRSIIGYEGKKITESILDDDLKKYLLQYVNSLMADDVTRQTLITALNKMMEDEAFMNTIRLQASDLLKGILSDADTQEIIQKLGISFINALVSDPEFKEHATKQLLAIVMDSIRDKDFRILVENQLNQIFLGIINDQIFQEEVTREAKKLIDNIVHDEGVIKDVTDMFEQIFEDESFRVGVSDAAKASLWNMLPGTPWGAKNSSDSGKKKGTELTESVGKLSSSMNMSMSEMDKVD